jgi:hypothetical protein
LPVKAPKIPKDLPFQFTNRELGELLGKSKDQVDRLRAGIAKKLKRKLPRGLLYLSQLKAAEPDVWEALMLSMMLRDMGSDRRGEGEDGE